MKKNNKIDRNIKKNKNNRVIGKIRMPALVLRLIVLILLIVSAVLLISAGKDKKEAAVINGNVIYAEEVQKEMEAMRHQVLGESPDAINQPETVEQWKQTALENCIRRQLILQLAKREGLVETSDYKELIQQMEQENKSRMEANQKGEVVYGVLSYTEESYFTYLLSNITPKLITALIEKELKVEESEIRKYFEEYKMGEQLKPAYYSIVMYSADPEIAVQKEKLQDIKKELDAGKFPENIDEESDISMTSIDVTREGRIAQRSIEFGETVFSLEVGETSEVFEDGGQFVLLYCEEIVEESKVTYEESREYTRKLYLEQRLEELLNRMRERADVSINKRALKKIVP